MSICIPDSLSLVLSFPFFEGGPHAPMSNDQAEKPEDTAAAVEPETKEEEGGSAGSSSSPAPARSPRTLSLSLPSLALA